MHNLWEDIEIPAGRPVVIACPGPGALKGIERIPENAYVIACNYGVCLPLPWVDEWLVLDERAGLAGWWHQALATAVARDARFVFSEELNAALQAETRLGTPDCVTPQGSPLGYDDPFPQDGVLRSNASVAGGALQRAYWGLRAGTTTRQLPPCYLLGLDMRGGTYFDRSTGYDRPGDWPYVATLDALISVLDAAGMPIRPISPTALHCGHYYIPEFERA